MPDLASRGINAGNCTHKAPGTYISERLYGQDDVYHCDADKPEIACVGDSRVAYGRVGYFDALSRKLVGDRRALEEYVLGPIRSAVFDLVWTHERYDCRASIFLSVRLSACPPAWLAGCLDVWLHCPLLPPLQLQL